MDPLVQIRDTSFPTRGVNTYLILVRGRDIPSDFYYVPTNLWRSRDYEPLGTLCRRPHSVGRGSLRRRSGLFWCHIDLSPTGYMSRCRVGYGRPLVYTFKTPEGLYETFNPKRLFTPVRSCLPPPLVRWTRYSDCTERLRVSDLSGTYSHKRILNDERRKKRSKT